MAKKLGEMNLDETLDAMSELKKNLAKVEALRTEVGRLEDMEKKLNKEVNELMQRKESIGSFIAAEEKKLMVRVDQKSREADDMIKTAKDTTAKASELMGKASVKMGDAEKLMAKANQTMDSAKGLNEENDKVAHDIKEIVKFINSKLGKL